jgi:hypothetical protein
MALKKHKPGCGFYPGQDHALTLSLASWTPLLMLRFIANPFIIMRRKILVMSS